MLNSFLKIHTSPGSQDRFVLGRIVCRMFGHRWRAIPFCAQTAELLLMFQIVALISGEELEGYMCKRCARLRIGREEFDLLHSYTEDELSAKFARIFPAESVQAFLSHLTHNNPKE